MQPDSTMVFDLRSRREHAMCVENMTTIDQLNLAKLYGDGLGHPYGLVHGSPTTTHGSRRVSGRGQLGLGRDVVPAPRRR